VSTAIAPVISADAGNRRAKLDLGGLLRSEWTKIRSVRSTLWALLLLVVLTLGFTTLFTALTISQWDKSDASEQRAILADPTSTILGAAERCDVVLLGSLLNLDAVASAARERGEDVAILCAGFQGAFALDDAYCAGRIVRLLGAERSDAAIAAELVADAFPDALAGLNARTYGPPGLEEDIAFCARENLLEVVPRLVGMVGTAAEIRGDV